MYVPLYMRIFHYSKNRADITESLDILDGKQNIHIENNGPILCMHMLLL